MSRKRSYDQRVTYVVSRATGVRIPYISGAIEPPGREEFIREIRDYYEGRKQAALAELRDIRRMQKIPDDDLIVITRVGLRKPEEIT